MKKNNKPKHKSVKDLAAQFEEDLKKTLPISIQPNGNIVYKNYYIRQNSAENWSLYHLNGGSLIEQFYLKTCALMAAKSYSTVDINKFLKIKQLDSNYWANFSDSNIYKKNIKTAKDFDRYCILLNKLEYSQSLAEQYKEQISKMFKWSFV